MTRVDPRSALRTVAQLLLAGALLGLLRLAGRRQPNETGTSDTPATLTPTPPSPMVQAGPGRAAITGWRGTVIWVATVLGASVIMAATVGVIAVVPAMAQGLHATQAEAQLIIDVTAVVLGALVLPTGALLDRYGRRKGLIVGFAGMLGALVWCSQAHSPVEMIFARLLTGMFAAVAFPATLVSLTTTRPAERRTAAVAAWAGAIMVGGTYGLLIGGICAQNGAWQHMFWALAVIVAVCLVATVLAVPETRDPEHANIDPLGSLLSFVGVGALTLAVIEMPLHPLTSPVIGLGLGTGLVCLVLFVLWELRAPTPMLDVRLFTRTTFATSTGTAFLLYFATYGWFFLSFQYYVYALGYSPIGAALGLLPNAVVTIPCTAVGGGLAKRTGWRRLVAFALVVGSGAFVMIAFAGQWFSLGPIAVGFAVFGICLGLPQGPVTEAIVDALPPAEQGLASAVNDASRELGAAFGIAVWGSVFNAAYRAKIDAFHGHAHRGVLSLIRDSPASGLAAASHHRRLIALIHHAVANGWTAAFLVGAGILAVAAVLVGRFGPARMVISAARAEPAAVRRPARTPATALEAVS